MYMFFFRNAVKNAQVYARKQLWRKINFLTISQTVPEIPDSDPENPSSNPRPYGRCDTSDERSAANCMFTDDLRLNWSEITDQQIYELR